MINRIKEYLEKGGSYEYGCSLFLSVTTNKLYATRLMSVDSEQNRKQLHVELTTYLKSQPGYWQEFVNGSTIEVSPVTESKNTNSIQEVFSESKPIESDIRNRITNERNDLMRERGHLHGQLHAVKTDEERFEICKQIMKGVQPKIDQLNLELKKIDSGEVPERFLRKTLSADEYKNIENLKKYIRRTKSELEKTTDPERAKILEAKLEEYNKKLKSCA